MRARYEKGDRRGERGPRDEDGATSESVDEPTRRDRPRHVPQEEGGNDPAAEPERAAAPFGQCGEARQGDRGSVRQHEGWEIRLEACAPGERSLGLRLAPC